ncbi:MAG: TnpV protein [Ruminococcaceae bacterium]|nr:TnpV protein [Oscillospiraceae bacterium]
MACLFEEMGGTYTLGADGMYYPNLELPEEETPRYGKYGRMRHTYLREHKKAYYTTLLFDGKLVAHLNEMDDAATAQIKQITKQMAKSQGITEALKVQDQTAWVGAMNNIRNAGEEIVFSELIYR